MGNAVYGSEILIFGSNGSISPQCWFIAFPVGIMEVHQWKEETHESEWQCTVWLPFVINAEAGEPGDGVPLDHVIQAYSTLPRILSQDILCRETQSYIHIKHNIIQQIGI